MRQDIEKRADIELVVKKFYEKVKKDDTIGFIFNDVVKIHWDHHIPVIVDFWATILLDNPVYQKNAMEKHFDLNRIVSLKQEHFDRWLLLFTSTIDESFEGSVAALAKTRAKSISEVLNFTLNNKKH